MTSLLSRSNAAQFLHHWRRALGALLLCVLVVLLLSIDSLFALLQQALAAAEPLIAAHPFGGRVVFVEYRREDPNVPIKLVHKMTQAQVKKEISQPEFGLKWKETIDILPRQHIIVFEKTPAGSE